MIPNLSISDITYSTEKPEDGKRICKITIKSDVFKKIKEKKLENIAKYVDVPGFRPGNAPKNIVAASLGAKLYEDVIRDVVPFYLTEIGKKERWSIIDIPNFYILNVGVNEDVTFSVVCIVIPEITLPDLKKIKVEKRKINVSDNEVKEELDAEFASYKKEKKYSGEMDDKWAVLYDKEVKNLKELKEKFKKIIEKDKLMKENVRRINEFFENLIKEVKFEIPRSLIEQESKHKEEEYSEKIKKLGLETETFLRNQKTSIDEMRKKWFDEAEKDIKQSIVITEIQRFYDIKVTDEEIEELFNKAKQTQSKITELTKEMKQYFKNFILEEKVVSKINEFVKN